MLQQTNERHSDKEGGGEDEGETAKLQIMTMAFVVFRCPFPLQGYVCSYGVSPSKKDHD